jgi:outer membrane protein OmpA-like peptidoglycan-associated protein
VRVRHVPISVRFMVMLGTLLLAISSCRFIPASQAQGLRSLDLHTTRTSVLVVITNPESSRTMRATGALVASSVRPGERVVILSSLDGALLASSQAPDSASVQVPAPPRSLPSGATSFQKARYRQAVRKYQNIISNARALLLATQQQELAAWANSIVAKADSKSILQSTQTISISGVLGVAVSDLSSLRQAGMCIVNTVIVIESVTGAMALSVPEPLAGLQASTVVVDDFPGNTNEEAAWQASLVQSGAARAVVLTPATDDQLIPVVREGLDGAIIDTLTSVLFGLGQYKLQTAALPQLGQLLRLLSVAFPQATASINGYTDSLPVPGGNLQLSRIRAQAVQQWLIKHGIAAGRLQAFGYGETDPVAPNSPAGQPLNRRVVVVIDPATSA